MMKIVIRRQPIGPMDEDQSTPVLASIETNGNRCVVRSGDAETMSMYKRIIDTSSYAPRFKENESYLIEALRSDYGQKLSVVGYNNYTDDEFSKDSSGLKLSTSFKYIK